MKSQFTKSSVLLRHQSASNQLFRKTQELVDLVRESRQTFSSFAKAKSSKLGKNKSSKYKQAQNNRARPFVHTIPLPLSKPATNQAK